MQDLVVWWYEEYYAGMAGPSLLKYMQLLQRVEWVNNFNACEMKIEKVDEH